MKRLLFALALGIVLVLAIASVASADNGPHGRFNGSTEACASCHRAHSAISADGMLLVANDVYELCTSCHDGTGAYTNVVDGYYDTNLTGVDASKTSINGGTDPHWGQAGLGLYGGGFMNARMLTDYGNTATQSATTNVGAANINSSATAWAVKNAYDTSSTAPTGRPVTSAHNVGQTSGAGSPHVASTVWGSGNYYAGGTFANSFNDAANTNNTLLLECTSCHTPHGAGGRAGGQPNGVPMPSYRLLMFTPGGSDGYEVATQVSATGYWDNDMTWNAGANAPTGLTLGGTAVVPSAAGVFVPDVTTKWYTPNTDYAYDPSIGFYRGTAVTATGGAPEMYVAVFAGLGDYGGRYWAYRRPAQAVASAAVAVGGRPTSCPNGAPGTGVPTGTVAPATNTTACAASVNTVDNPDFNNTPAHDVLGFWCATCHDRYLAPGGGNGTGTGSRDTDSGDPGYHYRHRSQGLGANVGVGVYNCVDCHNAHGTAAQYTALAGAAGYAWGDVLANTPKGSSWAGGSVLLKGDNRAICVRCHAAPVNFFNTVTTPTGIMVTP